MSPAPAALGLWAGEAEVELEVSDAHPSAAAAIASAVSSRRCPLEPHHCFENGTGPAADPVCLKGALPRRARRVSA